MLQSDLFDYSDAYIVVKGTITIKGDNKTHIKKNRYSALNNVRFIGCTSKINNVLIENAEDLDFVIPIYNLIEYSKDYRKTTVSLWNYYRYELSDDTNDNNGPNKKVTNSKSSKYKTSITGNTINYNVDKKLLKNKAMKMITLLMMQTKLAQKKLKLMLH